MTSEAGATALGDETASTVSSLTVTDIAATQRNSLVGGPFGSNLTIRDYVSYGVPVIRGQNMGPARWVAGDFVFVSDDKAQQLAANLASPGDIVFTQRGTLGQVAIVPDGAFEKYLVSQSQMKLTVNPDRADPMFAYYYFSSEVTQQYIRNHAITTGVPHINLGILRDMPYPDVPVPKQRVIAHILGTLDDKIELTRQMNQTLEELAAALFRSWFIDFYPVRAKMAGREPEGMDAATAALFPERLVESEVGEIPEGWRVGTLGEISKAARQSINPSRFPDQLFSHYSLPAFDAGRLPIMEPGAAIKSNKFVVPAEAVLVSKLNPHIPRVWLPAERSEHPRIASTEFVVLEPAASGYLPFLYAAVSSSEFVSGLQSMVTGTTGSHQRVPPHAMFATPLVIPTAAAISAFEAVAGQLYARGHIAQRENVTLAALRHTLLPRLLSGELRVPAEMVDGLGQDPPGVG